MNNRSFTNLLQCVLGSSCRFAAPPHTLLTKEGCDEHQKRSHPRSRLLNMKASQTTFPRRALGRGSARSPLTKAAPALALRPTPLRSFHRLVGPLRTDLLVDIELFNSRARRQQFINRFERWVKRHKYRGDDAFRVRRDTAFQAWTNKGA